MIIQKTHKLDFNELRLDDKIHGHAKIELTDYKTGKRKVVEHDNTFMASNLAVLQGGTASSMYGVYGLMEDIWSSGTARTPARVAEAFIRRTVGGIVLFDDAVTNNNRYPQVGLKMTANGYFGRANAGTPVELGSYNSNESSLGTNSVVLVYDWLTSQGNGDIGSICLTSENGGFYGFGNPSGVQGIDSGTYGNLSFTAGQIATNIAMSETYKFVRNNIAYGFTWDGENKVLTMNKYRYANGSSISIFNGRLLGTETYDLSNFLTSDENTINGGVTWDGNDKAIIFFGGSSYGTTIQNGYSKKYVIIDFTDDSITTGTFTNATNMTISIANMQYDNESGHIIVNIGSGTEWGIMKGFGEVNLTNGALEADYYSEESECNLTFTKMSTDGLWIVRKATSPVCVYIYDAFADTLYPFNDTSAGGSGVHANPERYVLDRRTNRFVDFRDTAGKDYYNPRFLSTINNLESVVTKNNTQTMKVTYTLTEA
jgi:hypothetical protein